MRFKKKIVNYFLLCFG